MKTQPFITLLILSIFIVFLLYCLHLCIQVRYFTDAMITENLPMVLGSAVGIFLIEQLLKEGKAAKH